MGMFGRRNANPFASDQKQAREMPQKPYAPLRRNSLFPGEESYFRQNPTVAGMAAQDDAVILNPFSPNTPQQQESVYRNEAARIYMRRQGVPTVTLTPEQEAFLNSNTYRNATPDERRATILARILSGDPSAGQPTKEQQMAVEALRRNLGW